MPYDPIKTRQLIKSAQAYERLPGSEFVAELSKMLEAAADEIRAFDKTKTGLEDDARRYQREAEQDREALKKLREGAGHGFEVAVASLKDIASSTKGGKKKAEDALKALFPAPADPVTPEQPSAVTQ